MTQWMTPALGTFSALTVMAFVLFFSLVLWILALRFDIHFSYHLQYSISHRPLPPSLRTHPICTRNPTLTTRTHTYYTAHTTHRYSLHSYFFFFHTTVSRSHPRVISICAPFFIPRLFRSFCPNYSFFFGFLALCFVSFLCALAFVDSSICALSLSLPSFS